MKKILPIWIIGILILSGFGAAALNNDREIQYLETQNFKTSDGGRDYTHTVLVEIGTGPWCYWCQFTNAVMHDIYSNGNYDFEYVELVDTNPKAVERINEFNIAGYPTSWFDGGYEVVVGGYDTWSYYTSKMDSCGARSVPDLSSEMRVFWLENEQIKVDINIQNNEASAYTGHIRAYIVEIVSRWKDYANADYHHSFLDYAFDQDITISAGETFTANTIWDGSSWNNPDITMDNIQVVLAVFNSEWHQGYSDPPSGNPFDAYYVDETIAATPGASTPPETPGMPNGPTEGISGLEYDFSSSTTDKDGDSIFYMFDWGDGTSSNWLGSYPSGEEVSTSHLWSNPGDFDIRVKAKDNNGSEETAWSPPLTIHIARGPELDIGQIKGGLLRINTVIKNDGELPATNVNWSIKIDGGLLLLNGGDSGKIANISAGGEASIGSKPILGFGKIRVTVTARITESSDTINRGGSVFLFYIHVNPGG